MSEFRRSLMIQETGGIIVSTYQINQDDSVSSPSSMITPVDCVFGKDGTPETNAVTYIIANTHAYVGQWNSVNNTLDIKQLSDSSYKKYNDGTSSASDIQNIGTVDGKDVFVKLPTFYYKILNPGSEGTIRYAFSIGKQSISDGWILWNTNKLIGVYKAKTDNNDLLRSCSGVYPKGGYRNISYAKNCARNRNNGKNLGSGEGYRLITKESSDVIALLFWAYYGTTNVQSICGPGSSSTSRTTGGLDIIGVASSPSNSSGNVKVFGLEDWYGCTWELLDNLLTGQYYDKLLDFNGNEIESVPVYYDSLNYKCISKINISASGIITPVAAVNDGSFTTYFTDFRSNQIQGGIPISRSGQSNYPRSGLILMYGISSPTSGDVGTRLEYEGPTNILD